MERRPRLTKEQKLAILRQSDMQPEWSQRQLGQWVADTFKLGFVPSQPTISVVLRKGGKLVKPRVSKTKNSLALVKQKLIKCPHVEKAMLHWLEIQIVNDEAVTVTKMRDKANELVHQLEVVMDGFVVSDTWIDRFMRRYVLNCPSGLSDAETTDCDEFQDVAAIDAARNEDCEKAGKMSSQIINPVVAIRTPAVVKRNKTSARKRKRNSEPSWQLKEVQMSE
ncbi:DNA-binding centromere protein B (CENP-B) [Plasmopara halstedii]|uniref:DNA-binding centromere protein B (CENP-B) n=1 Tax=Plasmopara halstedii TaxID=4781 RepID=A0A0P1ATV6_PLAHL|nr:DNA-binding centromere protein B (CENP-B) [Plasmopara halstedii]CEG45704.1 DNA-binding centromere protein B (CENP-B) [Plasmopara halstedii]|eukprot:XP_024582073.1 DNA-binding centromere protein B (CENP-B) [Plasmopara halstedii]